MFYMNPDTDLFGIPYSTISCTSNEEKKNCGRCKHFHLDGMFGFWCEKDHNWTLMKNCLDFEGD